MFWRFEMGRQPLHLFKRTMFRCILFLRFFNLTKEEKKMYIAKFREMGGGGGSWAPLRPLLSYLNYKT